MEEIDKEWLFKENIRITEEAARLEEEKAVFKREQLDTELRLDQKKAFLEIELRRLEMEKELLERKKELLEQEYRRLANDKNAFERLKRRQRTVVNNVTYINGVEVLFRGVNDEVTLKKRYRELLKIFHPDNIAGDTDIIQDINKEYNRLKDKFAV